MAPLCGCRGGDLFRLPGHRRVRASRSRLPSQDTVPLHVLRVQPAERRIPHAPAVPDASRLADAGRAIAIQVLAEGALLALDSSGRSPPSLVVDPTIDFCRQSRAVRAGSSSTYLDAGLPRTREWRALCGRFVSQGPPSYLWR